MKVKILDCTLRDGGYVNNWDFGVSNIKSIISKLSKSNVEIVECGFFSDKEIWKDDQSKFNSIEDMEKCIVDTNENTMYAGLINLGEFDEEMIPDYKGGLVSCLRVAFHMKQVEEAIEYCSKLVKKGYKVFIQPMVTINYTDKQLLELVEKVNEIKPYAFYIVDSFGVMKQSDLTRIFYLVDNNLNEDISIGYHAHNNLQLAYSNAQSLIDLRTSRSIIIDSSVFGMGRGAGNLNTELFTNYLNTSICKNYIIEEFLEIIDDILNSIYAENYWGYSLAHYLSATFNCHPNYASYLSDKNALTISGISDILRVMPRDKKVKFDKQYIENLYVEYQKNNINDVIDREIIKSKLIGKQILVLAPGKNLEKYIEEVKKYIDEDTIVISTNFISKEIESDYIFVSNFKRYNNINESKIMSTLKDKLILTSNIKHNLEDSFKINYNTLLNEFEGVVDNAGLMLIKLLIKCGIKEVKLAGFDGYSYENTENYARKDLKLPINHNNVKELNKNMTRALDYLSKDINIQFITPSKYNKCNFNKECEISYI